MRKILTALALALTLSFTLLTPAFAGGPTDQQAYAAISQFMGGHFKKLDIVGVFEPGQNAAVANYNVYSWLRVGKQTDAWTARNFGPNGETYTWSGRGEATFTHYNNGTWRLTKVCAGGTTCWPNLNILVK